MTTRIGIIGLGGRMGQAIARVAADFPEAKIVGGIVRNPVTEKEHGALFITNKPEELFPLCDVLIDFTLPEVTPAYADLAAKAGKPFVSGTTGLTEDGFIALREAAQKVPVLYASNTSLSLAVMKQLVKHAAALLKDQDYDVAILDRHHRMKKDAPSGTAKTLGECVTEGNGGAHSPAFSAIRAGLIVGEHEVSFNGAGETIKITHSVTNRDVFARGAVQAALWLAQQEPGYYNMDDVLGIG